MSSVAQQSRVDALIRLAGLALLAFGVALIYYTYASASLPGFAAPLVTVYYLLGLILLVVGLVGAFAKFK